VAGRRAGKQKHRRDGSTAPDASDQEVRAAAAVEQARAALHRAEQVLERSRRRVAERAEQARSLTIGDVLDGTLEFVRRHPLTGLAAAGILGFLFGRSTRR
jgi:ElaB/YqjD/DUF883 family membrane-anchored ribosome-binding protein